MEAVTLSEAKIYVGTYGKYNFSHTLFVPKTYSPKGYKKKRKSRVFKGSDCPLTSHCMNCSILDPISNKGFLC